MKLTGALAIIMMYEDIYLPLSGLLPQQTSENTVS